MGGISKEELESSIGVVSMNKYQAATDRERAEILEWVPKLRAMTDKDFVMECAIRILDSALMGRSRWNASGIHARADICADEADRRHQAIGHAVDCRGDNLYSKALNQVRREHRHAPNPPVACTCGLEKEKKGD